MNDRATPPVRDTQLSNCPPLSYPHQKTCVGSLSFFAGNLIHCCNLWSIKNFAPPDCPNQLPRASRTPRRQRGGKDRSVRSRKRPYGGDRTTGWVRSSMVLRGGKLSDSSLITWLIEKFENCRSAGKTPEKSAKYSLIKSTFLKPKPPSEDEKVHQHGSGFPSSLIVGGVPIDLPLLLPQLPVLKNRAWFRGAHSSQRRTNFRPFQPAFSVQKFVKPLVQDPCIG